MTASRRTPSQPPLPADPTFPPSLGVVGSPSWRPEPTSAVSRQILDVLAEFGIDTLFGIPGGAISSLYGALLHRPRFRVVNAKHETGAIFMAMGHALATNRPAVVATTAGPGITNMLTGLVSAYYENLPVIVLAGEVPTAAFGRGALQEGSAAEFDAVSLVRRTTTFAAQVTRADSATALVREAVNASTSGRRGPSFLTLPLDVAAANVVDAPSPRGSVHTAFDIDAAGCRQAMELLIGARRPLLLAGSGCRSAAGRAALLRLAVAAGAPVATSPRAKGVVPEDHPLHLGVFGFGGHESVIEYLRGGVDVVLACGADLDDFSTNAWSPLLAAATAFVQVDVDIARFGRNYPIDLGLLGPVDQIVEQMLRSAPAAPRRTPPGLPGVVTQVPKRSARGALTTAEVVLTMNEICPRDAVFTADMGEHLGIALHYLRIRDGGRFVTCLGFGSMGSGIGVAIGHQMADPTRRTYAITGDGCFLMFGMELATAVQHEVAVTIVIINDSRLNMCELGFRDQFGASPDLSTQVIDFHQVARGIGATAHLVTTRDELVDALSQPARGPVVLDVRIDPDVRLEGSQRTAALRQFTSD